MVESAGKLLVAFRLLQSHASGTAFLFASVFQRFRESTQNGTLTIDQRLALIDGNLSLSDVDQLSRLSLRVLRLLIEAQRVKDVGAAMLGEAYVTIAQHGTRYRDVEERDNDAPQEQRARDLVQSLGLTTVADYIAVTRSEGRRVSQTPAEIDEDVNNILAVFDWRQEQDSGRAQPYLAAIEGALAPVRSSEHEVEHLPFNEFDMAGITTAVTRYKSAGLWADFNVEARERGVVRITLENPVKRDGSFALFELHKLARRGFLRKKVYWVIQMYSQQGKTAVPVPHGCVFGTTQAVALSEAEWDLRFGFLSVLKFADAAQPD